MIPHESDAAYGTGFVIRNAEKCGQDGEEIVTCKICNQQFTRAIPAHSYDDGINIHVKIVEQQRLKK